MLCVGGIKPYPLTLVETGVKWLMELKDIGVLIPAYNAEKTLGQLIADLIDYGFVPKNIVVVDDGSKDGTAKIADQQGAVVIRNPKNTGKGWALKSGFDEARKREFKKVITIDADGQHQVAEIDNFLKLNHQYDVVIGSRRRDFAPMPVIRRLVNRTTSLVVSLLSDRYIPDVQSGFRLINLKIFDKVFLKTKNFQTESEIACKAIRAGYKIGSIPITAVYADEKSYIIPLTDTMRFVNMAVRFLWR